MAENDQQQGSAATSQEPQPGAGNQAANSAGLDSNIARLRKKADREKAELLAKITELENAHKTREQKELDEAYTRGRTETEARLTAEIKQRDMRNAITFKLLELGVPRNQVAVVLADNPDLDTTEDAEAAATAYAATWSQTFGKQPTPKTPGGSPSGGGAIGDPYAPPFTKAKLEVILADRASGRISHQKWLDLKPQIDAAMRAGEVV